MAKSMLLCVLVVAVAGTACKKKAEPAAPPAADAAAPLPAAQDAGAPPVPEAAAPDGGPAATGEAGAPHAGGGMGMLAGMFGGGGAASAAASPSAPSPAAASLRETGRELLEKSDANAFDRTLVAARVAQELPAAAAAGTPEPTGAPSTGPTGPVGLPNDADPCGTLVPSLLSCVSAQLGEAISAEEITEAIADCRTEFAGWPAERQAAMRTCDASVDCTAKVQCVAALTGTGGGEGGTGGETPPGPTVPPAGLGDDFCAKFTVRSAQCMEAPLGAADLGPAIEACRSGFADVSAEVRDGMAKCLDEPCDKLFECIGTSAMPGQPNVAATNQPPSDAPDLAGMFPTPDPAQVAALPPDTRALCAQLATRIDECWDTIIGTVAGTSDPATLAAMASIRPQIRPGLENACLDAAIGSSGDFQEMAAARPCFALPCDQLVNCIEEIENGP
jgi:hypothetical protein